MVDITKVAVATAMVDNRFVSSCVGEWTDGLDIGASLAG